MDGTRNEDVPDLLSDGGVGFVANVLLKNAEGLAVHDLWLVVDLR